LGLEGIATLCVLQREILQKEGVDLGALGVNV
jgi:hypothetical protein